MSLIQVSVKLLQINPPSFLFISGSMLKFSINANLLPFVQELFAEESQFPSHANNLKQDWLFFQHLSLRLHLAMCSARFLADTSAKKE